MLGMHPPCSALDYDDWPCTEGETEIYKETVEYDDANLSFILHGSEGHLFERFKVFKPSCKLIPKDQGCIAVLTIEYEKLNEDVPTPDKYMPFFINVTKDIDSHASEAWKGRYMDGCLHIINVCVCGNNSQNGLALAWTYMPCPSTDVTVVLLACYICMRLCLLILDSCPLYVLDLAEASSVSFSPYWCEIILTRKRAFTSIISCLTIFNWRIVKLNTSPASCWP